jgi:molybdopterin-guanine dinucleotide biosynthesis protein A
VHSAAILIGGKASRFEGRDKSALLVEGRTILSRQLETLSSITDDVMLVGRGRPGLDEPRAPSVEPRTPSPEPRHIPDIVPGCGPLSGLHAALTSARHETTLLVACDMPFVSAPLLRHLLSLAGDGAADIVVPRTERGYHPLCAVYSRACLEPAARRLARGEFKLAALFDVPGEMRVRVVTADALEAFGDPERLLANVNTSTEYRAIANGMQS